MMKNLIFIVFSIALLTQSCSQSDDFIDINFVFVEEKEEGGFVVSYLDLPGCITCGETMESAVANALDAKKHGLEQYKKKG